MGQPVQDVTTRRNSIFNRLQCLLRNTPPRASALPGLAALCIGAGQSDGVRRGESTSLDHASCPMPPMLLLKMNRNGWEHSQVSSGTSLSLWLPHRYCDKGCPGGSHSGQERVWSVNGTVEPCTQRLHHLPFHPLPNPLPHSVTKQPPSYPRPKL